MEGVEISRLRIHCIGIVAMNKELSSDLIEFADIESFPMLNGELSDNMVAYEAKGADNTGAAYETSLNTTATMQAKWIPIGTSNRKTPPDVRRGEKVVIYRYADVDKFYWTTLFYDMKLRKLETIIFAISNTRDEAAEGTADNTYFLEFSTHNKVVHLHTTKSDGEPFAYDIQLNTKDGVLTITDDIGNFISLDSADVRIEAKNADGSWIDMDRKDIKITAPDNIFMKAGKNIEMQAGISIKSKSGTSIEDETGTIKTKANTTTNTVPLTTFSQNVTIGNMLATKSFGSGAGGGSFEVTSPGTFTQPVIVQKLTSQQPIVAPNVD